MPDNGLTIDGLNSVSAITANDETPVWDAEAAPNEPTKKITGSNLAASIKTLGSLLGASDVVNDLTSTTTDKPLSANMGNYIKLTLGKIVIGDKNTSTVSVPTSTSTLCSSISLTAGTWVVVACANWQSNANGYRQIAFASSINPAREMSSTIQGISGKEAYQQVVRIIYTEGETLNLYALQNSGNTINIFPYLYATRISV